MSADDLKVLHRGLARVVGRHISHHSHHPGKLCFLRVFPAGKGSSCGGKPASKLREGQFTLNSEIASGVLTMVDAVGRMLSEIPATEQVGNNDYPELLAQLRALQEPN